MAKGKNKSFVQMKGKKNLNENIINPLKQYEYIEPKKKIDIKKIILIISCIFILILIIILFKITDNYSENKDSIKNNSISTNKQTNITTTKTTITTISTTITDSTTPNNIENDKLICKASNIEENMKIETQVVINFENKKLRTDEKTMNISLLNENNKETFNKYIETLEIFGQYLKSNEIYKVETEKKDNEYRFNVITTYQENNDDDTTLSYNQPYDSVKSQMEELNYICN